MNKKIIFCDFDGTLVGKDVQLSPRLKKAILAWEKKGHLFSLATGRIFAGHVQRIADELQLNSPQVSMGGAQIVDPIKREVIYEDLMPDDAVKKLIEILTEKNIYFWAEKDFAIYNYAGAPRHVSNAIVPHKKLAGLPLHNIPKIGIKPTTDAEIHFIEEAIVDMFPSLHVIRAGSSFGLVYDVTAAEASKHSGVLKVISLLDIPRENTIGIGDGYNDFPLLTVAGYKVAMGNAPDDLKAIADFVTTNQDADGVAMVIERLLKVA
ncbi:Cof-type HAD-IIB family hydrolase [soil metagenome]